MREVEVICAPADDWGIDTRQNYRELVPFEHSPPWNRMDLACVDY